MNFIDSLGPDASAAALGNLFEVRAANLNRPRDRVVLKEQPLDRLARRFAIDGLADGDPDGLPGLHLLGHIHLQNSSREV